MPAVIAHMTAALRRLEEHGWRVVAEAGAHRACGPSGTFLIGTGGMPARVEAGMQPVVVLWEPFPEEVAEVAGVYFVHGDHLVDFLLAQPHLLHPDVLFEYEAVRPAGTGA